MSDKQRRRAEELFQQAVEMPVEERSGFLSERCAAAVRREVDSLLAHFDEGTITSLQGTPSVGRDEALLVGEHVGPYKLLELIGEGGFGSVYMAEQEHPVRRKVALKLVKLGMDTKQVIARFEAERQALALMDHPHIARVLDAGATDTGRPYFVMELVRGIPITKFADKNSLTMRERLELFVCVCRAVQHAHQKGIIHRDLKPSNVLVTLHDGRPVPKVIDFGIAKATSERLTELTLFTEFRQFVGTPQYMSPEQAEMSGLDVDTRTDLYSLGVLLYELLTGTTPFDARTLRSAAFGEIQRIIREEEPPKPSQRLSTLGDMLTDIAKLRQAEPGSLSKLIRGDLDWIVMRALEKDRTRRYETAASLVDDVERHLNNQPVLAGPPSRMYSLRKFIRRHRAGVMAGSFVAAAVVLGLALATYGFVQASWERDAARAAQARADAEAVRSRAISNFFQDMLASVDPMQLAALSGLSARPGALRVSGGGLARDVSVAEMLRLASTRVDSAFEGDAELEAAARETIGMTMRGLGLYAAAEPELRAALEIRESTLARDHPDTLRAQLALGSLLLEAGQGVEAKKLARRAHSGMRRTFGEEDPRTLSCASILAEALSEQGEYKESEQLFKETLARQRSVLGLKHRDTLVTMWKASYSYLTQWRLAEAQALASELYDTAHETLSPNDSLNILSKPLMGWCYLAQFQYAQAKSVFEPGLDQCRRILGAKHPFTYVTMHGLARSLQGRELLAEKEQLQRRALAGLRTTRGRQHWHTISSTGEFARWLALRGDFDGAEQLYRSLCDDCQAAFGQTDGRTLSATLQLAMLLEERGEFSEAIALRQKRLNAVRERYGASSLGMLDEHGELARALVRAGRLQEGRNVTRNLLSELQGQAEVPDADGVALNNYAWTLLTCVPADLRDPERALEFARRAEEVSEGRSPPILDTVAYAHFLLGNNDEAVEIQRRSLALLSPMEARDLTYFANMVRYLVRQGDAWEVAGFVRQSVDMYKEALGEDNPLLARRFVEGADWLASEGCRELAESLLNEALDLNRSLLGERHEQVALNLQSLADLYYHQGRFELAERTYREVLDIRRELLGDEHLLVATTLRALGLALRAGGRNAAALVELRAALDIYEQLDGLATPAALDIKRNVAQTLVALGQLDEAEPLARETLSQHRALYGQTHRETALAMRVMAMVLIEKAAGGQGRSTVARMRGHFGPGSSRPAEGLGRGRCGEHAGALPNAASTV